MAKIDVSRRRLLAACAAAPAAAMAIPVMAGATAVSGLTSESEAIVRANYAAWVNKDWNALDHLLADRFTFSSAAPDDHISKAMFKKQCWDTQNKLIGRFDLVRASGTADDAFVMYVCTTTKGTTFSNVEYFRLAEGKILSIECYFGGPGYATAADH
jgi:ketosteroid isomerase-like protein